MLSGFEKYGLMEGCVEVALAGGESTRHHSGVLLLAKCLGR